jgi:hypothetical protein
VSASCASGADALRLQDVAGEYVSTLFVAGGLDVLEAGGSLSLSLDPDGSVGGSLVVPEDAGGPVLADMTGTYSLNGSSIVFQQSADTFVRDATWTWDGGVLDGLWVGSGSGQSIQVRLTR